MTRRTGVSAWRGRTLYGATVVACLGAALVTATPTAQSASDPQCPAAYPVSSLARHDAVHGLTVSQGTTPDPFTGEVIGVLNDAIAPGIDMIMVDLTSTAIDDAGGIWAGMSGSPVYASDGRLIGAVAYGLAFGASPVAGVTPAADMQALLDAQPLTAAAGKTAREAINARSVKIPGVTARKLVAGGDLTSAQAAGGFTRLPLPLGISGLSAQRPLSQVKKFINLKDVRVFRAGAASSSASPAVVAGGNLAASISYGDLTEAGTGTATAVCGNEVLAFGHPMLWSGSSTMTMHGADALYIQKDLIAPFKVSNLTAPVGEINQDRLVGLHGLVGTTPQTATISAHVTSTAGGSRDGTTEVSVPDQLPFVSAFHLLVDEDRVLDQYGPGSARVRWTVEGLRSDGSPFEYSRVNEFASPYDITFETIFESYSQLTRLLNNSFDHVTITGVSYRSLIGPDYHAYHLGKVERRVGGSWVKMSRRNTTVSRGSTMHLRVTLNRADSPGQVVVPVNVDVPKGRGRGFGYLQLSGGASTYGGGGKATSFDSLLDQLANATHNNSVVAQLRINQPGPNYKATQARSTDQVVTGQFFASIQVR
ncbi:MAG: hypothetical protein WAK18_06320 [Nocardioidaceae bacterium]